MQMIEHPVQHLRAESGAIDHGVEGEFATAECHLPLPAFALGAGHRRIKRDGAAGAPHEIARMGGDDQAGLLRHR